MRIKASAGAVLAAGLVAGCATGGGFYTVNGQPVDLATQAYLINQGLVPGDYWLAQNGNWGVMGSGMPMGNIHAGITTGPGVLGGSGEIYGNGSWSYGSDYGPAGGVGGPADGCVYAGDWSNC